MAPPRQSKPWLPSSPAKPFWENSKLGSKPFSASALPSDATLISALDSLSSRSSTPSGDLSVLFERAMKPTSDGIWSGEHDIHTLTVPTVPKGAHVSKSARRTPQAELHNSYFGVDDAGVNIGVKRHSIPISLRHDEELIDPPSAVHHPWAASDNETGHEVAKGGESVKSQMSNESNYSTNCLFVMPSVPALEARMDGVEQKGELSESKSIDTGDAALTANPAAVSTLVSALSPTESSGDDSVPPNRSMTPLVPTVSPASWIDVIPQPPPSRMIPPSDNRRGSMHINLSPRTNSARSLSNHSARSERSLSNGNKAGHPSLITAVRKDRHSSGLSSLRSSAVNTSFTERNDEDSSPKSSEFQSSAVPRETAADHDAPQSMRHIPRNRFLARSDLKLPEVGGWRQSPAGPVLLDYGLEEPSNGSMLSSSSPSSGAQPFSSSPVASPPAEPNPLSSAKSLSEGATLQRHRRGARSTRHLASVARSVERNNAGAGMRGGGATKWFGLDTHKRQLQCIDAAYTTQIRKNFDAIEKMVSMELTAKEGGGGAAKGGGGGLGAQGSDEVAAARALEVSMRWRAEPMPLDALNQHGDIHSPKGSGASLRDEQRQEETYLTYVLEKKKKATATTALSGPA